MKTSILIIAIFAIFSCNTHDHEKLPPVTTTIITHPDSSSANTDVHYFWEATWEGKKGLIMKKTEPLPEDSLTPDILIRKVNQLYPDIKLLFTKLSNDTIFISLKNSRYLTQEAGTTGAEGYLAIVTYNLTELKNINFVDFSFKAGDHALPGTYTRTDFIRKSN
jgi:hypothetical protein